MFISGFYGILVLYRSNIQLETLKKELGPIKFGELYEKTIERRRSKISGTISTLTIIVIYDGIFAWRYLRRKRKKQEELDSK